ncbi:MAG: hypothetical protein HY023_18225 [Chloroflexi bacterium]|nr:hypothetical protein [Chloroflexota bacterium]
MSAELPPVGGALQTPSRSAIPESGWARTSFITGLIGFLLSLTAPVPFIPLISWLALPLGLVALAAGWVARRRARLIDDHTSHRRAGWGMALGCLGWIIDAITLFVTVAIVGALGVGLFFSLLGRNR